jgi:hypothetical protein
MRALVFTLLLAACGGSSTQSSPDLAMQGDMVVYLPTQDMAGGGCTSCQAFSTTCGTENCSKVVKQLGVNTLCCKTPGTTAADIPCTKDEDCVADAVCLPDKLGVVQNRCYSLCDGSHPCPSGTCNTFAGLMVCR